MKELARISDAEREVMKLIWREGPQPIIAIIEALSTKQDWAPRTIRTLVERLVKKGALEEEEDGRRQIYKAKVTMEACLRQESRSFMDRVFGGEPAAMLIHLVKNSKLSAKEIEELKDILNAKGR